MKWKDRVRYYWFTLSETLNTDVKEVLKSAVPTKVKPLKAARAVELPEEFTVEEALKHKAIQLTCEHDFVLETQVWHPVDHKKYQLRDVYACQKCLLRKIEEIEEE